MQTLILENVPIGSEIEILNGLHELRKLNIRNSGVTEIERYWTAHGRGSAARFR